MSSAVLTVTDRLGAVHTLDALEGWSLMQIMKDQGMPIKATCAGCGDCSTCHIYVTTEPHVIRLPEPTKEELDVVDELIWRSSQSRLACQIIWNEGLNGLRVTVPPEE